jgi:hypothetical protein
MVVKGFGGDFYHFQFIPQSVKATRADSGLAGRSGVGGRFTNYLHGNGIGWRFIQVPYGDQSHGILQRNRPRNQHGNFSHHPESKGG